ncbi:MAG: isoprenylcysteine carboxylmethyltransferase family protein [Actinobacteria bacterium]|nr:isoprenylcysteine carboxylmethyltransferase family protein [Actinomycetota bacterium]
MPLPQLGARGQGWVWGQFLLAAVVILVALVGPRWTWPGASWLGGALVIIGVVLGMWSLRSLGESLTPYPQPRSRATLVEHGPYRVVRHPIYSSILISLLGVSVAGSLWALLPLAVLVVWWLGKASVEERFLRERYPGYQDYCLRVPHRLIPWVL